MGGPVWIGYHPDSGVNCSPNGHFTGRSVPLRGDRLIAALLLLQARERVTAQQLADDLEVSVSTARRDLEALAMAGVPVYPRRGHGGGWSLVGRARTDLTGLTDHEAQALFLLVGPAATGSPAATTAMRKLVQALPATFRTDAEAAAAATLVDPTRWGERERTRPPVVALLQRAVVRRRKVRLVYRARDGADSDRLVDPWGVIDKDDVWYLLAGTDRGRRTFRIDRIRDATLTDEHAERPEDLSLEDTWRQVSDEIEQRRSRTWATVVTEPRFVPILRTQFGRHTRIEDDREPGRVRMLLGAPTPLDIARHLAGWGSLVDVLEPDSVRLELGRIGAELTARYDADGSSAPAGRPGRAPG